MRAMRKSSLVCQLDNSSSGAHSVFSFWPIIGTWSVFYPFSVFCTIVNTWPVFGPFFVFGPLSALHPFLAPFQFLARCRSFWCLVQVGPTISLHHRLSPVVVAGLLPVSLLSPLATSFNLHDWPSFSISNSSFQESSTLIYISQGRFVFLYISQFKFICTNRLIQL
jgi:hypothetical protein